VGFDFSQKPGGGKVMQLWEGPEARCMQGAGKVQARGELGPLANALTIHRPSAMHLPCQDTHRTLASLLLPPGALKNHSLYAENIEHVQNSPRGSKGLYWLKIWQGDLAIPAKIVSIYSCRPPVKLWQVEL